MNTSREYSYPPNKLQHAVFAGISLQNTVSYNPEELTEKIHIYLQALPVKCKEVIDFYFFQNKSIPEIITIIGMSESTIRNRLGYGLYLLKKMLQKDQ